jgi:hypothetical protein
LALVEEDLGDALSSEALVALSTRVEVCRFQPGPNCDADTHLLHEQRRQWRLRQQRAAALRAAAVLGGAAAVAAADTEPQWVPVDTWVLEDGAAAPASTPGTGAASTPGVTPLRFPDFFLRNAVDGVPALGSMVPPTLAAHHLDDLALCGAAGCRLSASGGPHGSSGSGSEGSGSAGLAAAGVAAPEDNRVESSQRLRGALAALRATLVLPGIVAGDLLVRLPAVADALAAAAEPGSAAAEAAAALSTSARRAAGAWPQVVATAHAPLHASPMMLHRVVAPLRGAVLARVVHADDVALVYQTPLGGVPAGVDVFHPEVGAAGRPAVRLVTGMEATVRQCPLHGWRTCGCVHPCGCAHVHVCVYALCSCGLMVGGWVGGWVDEWVGLHAARGSLWHTGCVV